MIRNFAQRTTEVCWRRKKNGPTFFFGRSSGILVKKWPWRYDTAFNQWRNEIKLIQPSFFWSNTPLWGSKQNFNISLPDIRPWAASKILFQIIPTRFLNAPVANQNLEVDPEIWYGQWIGQTKKLSLRSPLLFSMSWDIFPIQTGSHTDRLLPLTHEEKFQGTWRQLFIMPYSLSIPNIRV